MSGLVFVGAMAGGADALLQRCLVAVWECPSVAFIVSVFGRLERVFHGVCEVSLKANEKGA